MREILKSLIRMGLAWVCVSTPVMASEVWFLRIEGSIDPGSADYLAANLERANAASGVLAVVVELDTPGGLVASVRLMAQAVGRSKVPVIVHVTPSGAAATSAGALLMLSSHVAAMAPGTNVGAAHPVDTQGQDVKGAMGEKVLNDTAAFARGLAELRGRDAALAELIVSKSKSLTAEEALKQKFIDLIAADRDGLLRALSGREVRLGEKTERLDLAAARKVDVEMSWGQKLLHLVANPNVAAILMTLGMLLLYAEISNPGITIAGVLGGVCLLIAFIAFQVLPVRTGGLALLVLSLVLMVAEAFVTTHGILAAGGVLSFVLGALWFLDPSETDLGVSRTVIASLALALSAGVATLAFAAARTRMLTQKTRARIGGGGVGGLLGYDGVVENVEESGLHGIAHFRGESWGFMSKTPVRAGDHVRAVAIDGLKVVVEGGSHGTDSK